MAVGPWLLLLLISSRAGPYLFAPGPWLASGLQVRSLTAWRFVPFDGRLSYMTVIFDEIATSSPLSCARLCLMDDRCAAFTVIEAPSPEVSAVFCRAHYSAAAVTHPDLDIGIHESRVKKGELHAIFRPRAKSYIVEGRQSREPGFFTTWLGMSCESSTDCPLWTGCFGGQCLCRPWEKTRRYYSVSGDFCLSSCSEPIRDSFLTYPASFVYEYDSYFASNMSVTGNVECMEICEQSKDCRIAEYDGGYGCFLYTEDGHCGCNVGTSGYGDTTVLFNHMMCG